jgi:hypothetical protein
MRFDMAKISKSGAKTRSAATGTYVKPGYAKANPAAAVVQRAKTAKPAAKSAARPAAQSGAKSKAAAKKK